MEEFLLHGWSVCSLCMDNARVIPKRYTGIWLPVHKKAMAVNPMNRRKVI